MDVKFDKIKQNNIFLASLANRLDENFFMAPSNFDLMEERNGKQGPNSTRLNDFDSNILENNAYHELSDDMLKLEHKIELLENSFAKINSEIEGLESLGETQQIKDLRTRKSAIEKELAVLNKEYGDMGIGAKISSGIASVVNFTSNKKTSALSKTKTFLTKKVLAKISKKFSYSQNMKEALEKLSNINSNVDELITMQTPYGEKVNRYEKLTAYLNKANVIHSQISSNMKDFGNVANATSKSKMI